MDLRDYLILLRRGAPTIAIAVALAALLSVLYLQATPKVYQATAALLVSPNDPQNLGELQVGGQYAQSASNTIATLIGTEAVLAPAVDDLQSEGSGTELSVDSLQGMVTASSGESTAVVTISASASDPALAAVVANAVAARAASEVPGLTSTPSDPRDSLLTLRVIQEAKPPAAPLSPNSKRVGVLFLAIGLATGLAVTLVRQSLDSRLRQASDVTSMTQVPLLATLAHGHRLGRDGLVVRDDPHSPPVEGYRVLRTNLGALSTDDRGSVVFTSANHDPAAVQVPANLAWSLAQTGRRVLLVDLDLRHSPVATIFDLAGSAGAVDVLTGDADFQDVVRSTALPCLDIIPGGVALQAPSDLLSGHVLDSMIARAEAGYDYVLIHAPPLLRYTDAAVVARTVSQTVLLVRSGYTQAPDLTRAMGVLANVGVTPVGIVLSDARASVAANLRGRDARPAVSTSSTTRGEPQETGRDR